MQTPPGKDYAAPFKAIAKIALDSYEEKLAKMNEIAKQY